MSDISEIVVTQLKATNGVPANVFPVIMPQGLDGVIPNSAWPCVVYHVSNTVDANHAGGQSGLRGARFQLDCYSKISYLEARTISKAVRAALNGFNAIIETEMDMPTNPAAKGRSYRVMLQATVWYNED